MKSRRERRKEARENKTTFEPQYNGRVITKAEYDEEVKNLKESKKKTSKKEETESSES